MSNKYAREMILIPKPSSDQTGGHATQDNMDQYWQRRLLVDRMVNAPHVDRTMGLLNDMKQVQGQAQPSSLPGQGPDASQYFQLQRQLQKTLPLDKNPNLTRSKVLPKPTFRSEYGASTRPPQADSVQGMVERQNKIDDQLERFRQKAKQEWEQEQRTGDESSIQEARHKWDQTNYYIDKIKDFDRTVYYPGEWEEFWYGRDKAMKQYREKEKDDGLRRDQMWRDLENWYPNQQGQGYESLVWQRPRGWVQE